MTAVFHENWFGEANSIALERCATKVKDLPGRIVEIGSWEGRSTTILANAVFPKMVDAVDTWQGSPGEESETLAAERDVYEQFTTNIAALTEGNVIPHRMGWRKYFQKYHSPIALCFIDAAHTYREVRDNIRAAMPLMVSGGILCGDDFAYDEVRNAAAFQLGELNVIHNFWWVKI